MGRTFIFAFVVILFSPYPCKAKIYNRCQLAKELVQKHGFDRNSIADWICLVKSESSYDTAAKGGPNSNGSYDHGLFQINDRYWCSPPGPHNDCGVTCSALRSDDITASAKCAKKIFRRHGFNAWYGWKKACEGKDVSSYIKDCGI